MQKAMGSYCTYSIPGKTAVLVPECVVKDLWLAHLTVIQEVLGLIPSYTLEIFLEI